MVKNKVAPPFRQVEFDHMYAEGISREGGLLDVGLEMGLVEKSGAWFNYGTARLGQGRENAKEFLRQNPDIGAELERQIRESLARFPDRDRSGTRDLISSYVLPIVDSLPRSGSSLISAFLALRLLP